MNKQNKVFIGIDPGKQGFIVLYDEDTKDREFLTMPFKDVGTGEFLKNGKEKTALEFDYDGFRDLIFEIKNKYPTQKFYAIIEEVIGREGWSAQNSFNFGYVAGMQLMILIMLKATYKLIKPQKWQSIMYRGVEKVKKPSKTGKTMIHDTKATSAIVAQKIAPEIDFRRTARARTIDDNKTDAFLMCEYGRLYEFKNI